LKDKPKIEKLFSDKFRNFEAKVDPKLWSKISSQLKPQPGLTTLKKAFFSVKTAIILSVAGLIMLSTLPFLKKETIKKSPKNYKTIKKATKKKVPTLFVAVKKQPTLKKEKIKKEMVPIIKVNEAVIEGPPEQEAVSFSDTIKKIEKIEKSTPQKEANLLVVLEDGDTYTEEKATKNYTIERLPNVFTPNNDGNNDFFMIKTTGLQDFNITIINDQNSVVYRSNDTGFIWGGLDFYQKPSKPGRYIYYITARDNKGNSISKYSPLTIRR